MATMPETLNVTIEKKLNSDASVISYNDRTLKQTKDSASAAE